MIIYEIVRCDDNKDSRHESAHRLLSDMLYRYTSHKYSEMQIDINGKPYIDSVPFSISHSKELAVVCMCVSDNCTGDFVRCSESDTVSIGVDVEVISGKERARCSKIAGLKFSDKENEYLSNFADDEEYIRQFALIWTKKESFGKFTGVGLKDALRFDTTLTGDKVCLYSTVVRAGDTEYALSIAYNSD